MTRLQQLGINYQSDVRPLFGNAVMIGAPQSSISGASSNNFLIVWVTKDAGKLSALVKKLGVHSVGTHDGATLYQSGGVSTLAIDGATLVFAPSSDIVTGALDRHAHGGGFSFADFSRDLAGLSQSALIEAFGELTGVLSTPRAAKARSVPWVGAIRGYGAAISATPSGLTFQYRVDTSGGSLSPSQLPIASGSSAPSFAGAMPITVALNDPAQVFSFAEAAEQSASPRATPTSSSARRPSAPRPASI